MQNSGDDERIALEAGQYMESEVIGTEGTHSVSLNINKYRSGNVATIKYKTAATRTDPSFDSGIGWQLYSSSFESIGYVKVRVEF